MFTQLALGLSLMGSASVTHEHSKAEALAELAWQEAEQQAKLDPRHQADIDADTKLGKNYTEQVEKEFKLSQNAAYIERVQRIGAEIAAIARKNQVTVTWGDKRLNPFDYTFKVVEDKDINAFSLPGGFIYVYEGLIQFAETDDELAGVLAHEVAHASFRHVATLQRESAKLQSLTLPLILISIFSGSQTLSGVGTLASLIGIAKGSGWSVAAEEAADYGGLQYMLYSEYQPVGILTFIERLAKEQRFMDRIDMGIFRTHPPSRERAERLVRHLGERNIPLRRSMASLAYRVVLRDAENGQVEAVFDRRKLITFAGPDARRRAEEAALKLNEFFDQVPDLFDVSVRSGNVIVGRRQELFRVRPEDAAAAKVSTEELTRQASAAIKRSLYLLAYRVWDGR
jgi:predicted Zn-dependent protease